MLVFRASQRASSSADSQPQALPSYPVRPLGCYLVKPTVPHSMHTIAEDDAQGNPASQIANFVSSMACSPNMWHFPGKPTPRVLEQLYPTTVDCRTTIQSRLGA